MRDLRMPVRCLLLTLVLTVGVGCPSRPAGPELPTRTLLPAVVGEVYRAELTATGGTAPLTYAVEGLPPGFSFYTGTGVLEGTARAAGTWRLLVSVTDSRGRSHALSYELELAPDADDDTARLTIANWNIQWFGSIDMGPSNDPLQFENAATVLASVGADVWALNEIVSVSGFHQLVAEASTRTSTTYRGLLASAPEVEGGSRAYSATEPKLALVWKEGVLSDVSAEVILTAHDFAFAGRPPMKVEATVTIDGVSVPLTFVVLHMKAFAETASYQRRRDAAVALKGWLDALPQDREVIVLGDWNDDLDASIAIPYDTPYRALVESPRYVFVTEVFSLEGISTTTSYPTPIDHQLVTAPMASRHVAGSTEAVHPPIPHFGLTTSDHYPVRSTFVLGTRSDGDGAEAGGATQRLAPAFDAAPGARAVE